MRYNCSRIGTHVPIHKQQVSLSSLDNLAQLVVERERLAGVKSSRHAATSGRSSLRASLIADLGYSFGSRPLGFPYRGVFRIAAAVTYCFKWRPQQEKVRTKRIRIANSNVPTKRCWIAYSRPFSNGMPALVAFEATATGVAGN